MKLSFYLGKEGFAGAGGPIHENVSVEAAILACVVCGNGNVTNTRLQARLQARGEGRGGQKY